jgi:hypothetical protein
VSYLKNFAYFIKDFCEHHFHLTIPTLNTGKDLPDQPTSTLISVVGMMLLGTIGLIGTLCVTHWFFPDILNNVPILSTFIENINSTICHFIFYFKGANPTAPSAPTPGGDNILPSPESISRSSSGDSDKTIRFYNNMFGYTTPPFSRSPTPGPSNLQDIDITNITPPWE